MRSLQRGVLFYVLLIFATAECTDVPTIDWTSFGSDSQGNFECANGNKINGSKLCDGIDDCNDLFMTDECDCKNMTDATKKTCSRWRLLQYIFPGTSLDAFEGSGDGHDIFECIMHGDLVNCTENPDALRCGTDDLCVTRTSFCDDDDCCPDESDERHLGFGLKCAIANGNSEVCLLPETYLEDDIDHCIGGRENCYYMGMKQGKIQRKLRKNCFECLNKEHTILSEQVCDGVLDCSDFSDECLCANVQTEDVCKLMYNKTVKVEEECLNRRGDVSCGDGTCISKTSVCDEKIDCKNGIDEIHCYSMRYKRQLTVTTEEKEEIYCNMTEIEEDYIELEEAVMCDGIPECDDLRDECDPTCNANDRTYPDYCNTTSLTCIPGSLVCNGIKESQTFESCNYTYVSTEEDNCPGRFYCTGSNGQISIDSLFVCDGVANCVDGSDESRERNCKDGRFYCETNETASFSANPEQALDFVPRYQVGNGRYDCNDGSDECPTTTDGAFSFNSRTEMISWAPFRWILWINAILAFFGNAIVIIYSLMKMREKSKNLSTVARCHHFLVFTLSIADLLMSIYLLVLVIHSTMYSGSYCPRDKTWRASATCTALGALALISSEMSVFTMLIMAIYRFATIYDPLNISTSKTAERAVRLSIVAGWIFSVLIAVIPMTDSVMLYFTTHVWADIPIFSNNVIKIDDITYVADKILTSASNGHWSNGTDLPQSITRPSDIVQIFSQGFPRKKIMGWYTLYGQNSICLPRLFTTTNERGWQYSVAIMGFNLSAFCFMVITYGLMIYYKRKSMKNLKRTSASKIPKNQLMERVTRLLVTDFLCWVPVCLIAFAYLAGVEMSTIVYVISGIVLLPINSALNPILYSSLYEILLSKIIKKSRRTATSSKTASSKLSGNNNAESVTGKKKGKFRGFFNKVFEENE